MTSDKEIERITKQVRPNIDPVFRTNPGKNGMIFNEEHPYFDVPKRYNKLAKNNFNLPIPEKDAD